MAWRMCLADKLGLIGKRWLAVATFVIWPAAAWPQSAVPLTVLDLRLTCDSNQCRTALLEVHERSGVDANHIVYLFAAPSNVTFDDAHMTGVEVEGSGELHYVHAPKAGSGWLQCEWLAKARAGGDAGLARGYCWIAIKK